MVVDMKILLSAILFFSLCMLFALGELSAYPALPTCETIMAKGSKAASTKEAWEHVRQSRLRLGGLSHLQIVSRPNVFLPNEHIYTPENSALVKKMLRTLRGLLIDNPNTKLINDRAYLRDLHKKVKSNKIPTDQNIFKFLWELPEVQIAIREALDLGRSVVSSGYQQDRLILFLQKYSNVMAVPTINGSLDLQSAIPLSEQEQNRHIFLNKIWPLFSEYKLSVEEIINEMAMLLNSNNFQTTLMFPTIKSRYQFRIVLIDGIVGEYQISRFMHAGVMALGVHFAPSTFYDGKVDSVNNAIIHDHGHAESYFELNGFYAKRNNKAAALYQLQLQPYINLSNEELMWITVDKLRAGLGPIEVKNLDDFVFSNNHEASFSIINWYPRLKSYRLALF